MTAFKWKFVYVFNAMKINTLFYLKNQVNYIQNLYKLKALYHGNY